MRMVKKLIMTALLIGMVLSLSGCLAEMLTAAGRMQQTRNTFGF